MGKDKELYTTITEKLPFDVVEALAKKGYFEIRKNRGGQPTILVPSRNPFKNWRLGKLLCDEILKNADGPKRTMRKVPIQIPVKFKEKYDERASQDLLFHFDITQIITDWQKNGGKRLREERFEL